MRVPRAALAREASARRAGQYSWYGQAASAKHPAASVVRRRRRPAPPAEGRSRRGTRMSSGQILLLGGVAGSTIFIGLPVGRMQSVSPRVKSFLSASATGILLFLIWDVLSAAVKPVEDALKAGHDGRFFGL